MLHRTAVRVTMPARRAVVITAVAVVALAASPATAEQRYTSCPAGRDASCICWIENGIARMSCTATTKRAHATTPASRGDRPVADIAAVSPAPPTRAAADLPRLDPTLTDGERRSYWQKRQDKIDNELLAAQRARFVARATGKSDEQVETLNRTFTDLQEQRRVNLTQLRALGSGN